jgi:hypothetical protein
VSTLILKIRLLLLIIIYKHKHNIQHIKNHLLKFLYLQITLKKKKTLIIAFYINIYIYILKIIPNYIKKNNQLPITKAKQFQITAVALSNHI